MISLRAAVLGGGSWGTALAYLLARKGYKVKLWVRREEVASELNTRRENLRYLPGVFLPEGVTATASLEEALKGAEAVIFAVPSHAFREVVRETLPFLPPGAYVINGAKGLEVETRLRLSQVFATEAGEGALDRYVVLSGPSHAEEVAREQPTAVVVASRRWEAAEWAQEFLMCPFFRVYTNPDLVGVELGGALKNIIALGTGICEGIGFGDNAKAALMTRGLTEIARLGVRLGANPLTFTGLAGVGDLIVTCTSRHSRNRRAGWEIGKGKSLEEALAAVGMVVEGVRTTKVAYALAQELGVKMPITVETYKVLFEGLSPLVAAQNLMGRARTREIEEVGYC
ncbi:Glycerol-3-phosphate dehydrogenase (NAD(P)(+)) [Ammonifex degensii KC4]|uniref:Glycerol-3-phosphate dehydrogenase [NAD(P)+] n=1 Tax=Ammonifex degensii (strain DSM 10501 / KC4) TaxID=429009 RepID=C9RBZ3_AMMDK|nr:Glycerol-3-phosphate dehydrogenase (NAD(P)(+)) [Ammonifex degensii KC4]